MPKRPNVVFILADDLGCTGAREDVSPHLDRLAAGGLLFTSGYADVALFFPTRFVFFATRACA